MEGCQFVFREQICVLQYRQKMIGCRQIRYMQQCRESRQELHVVENLAERIIGDI